MGLNCVVTGAGRGLGLEFVRQLHARGDSIVATARRPADVQALAQLGVEAVEMDVTRAADVDALAQRLAGRSVDILVNNAGLGGAGDDLEHLDLDSLLPFFATNAVGPVRVAQALLPQLRVGGRRLVVNVTSRMGSIADNTSGGYYGYRASKTALNMLSRCLALELQRDGIAVLVVHPGWVRTDMGGAAAPLSVEESVRGMLAVMERWGLRQSGGFVDNAGTPIPW